jgi:DNA transformation protein
MAVSRDYVTYVLDQLAGLGSVLERRMFGGIGLYFDGLFFGLIDDDVVYLRVDDESRPKYVAQGMQPFRPVRDAPEKTTPNYYELPGEILEDADDCAAWARDAVRAARLMSKPARRVPKKAGASPTRRLPARKTKPKKPAR